MKKFIFFLIFTFIFFLNFIPVKDTDFGWHYRCGNELLQGAPCLTNTFSYFLPNYHMYYPSFIFDGVTALVFNLFGFLGLSLLHALVITGIFYIFYKLSKQNIIISVLIFPIALFFSNNVLRLGWRPQVITLFFVLMTVILLKWYKAHLNHIEKKYMYIFPILMVVWVNTHIGFFTGLVVYAFFLFDIFVEWVRKMRAFTSLFLFGLIGVVSLLATLINPYGYKVYIELYRHFMTPLNTLVAEWVAPPLFYLAVIVTLFITICILSIFRNKFSLFELLILVFFGLTAMMARRNTPLFFITACALFLSYIPRINIKDRAVALLFPLFGAITIVTMVIMMRFTYAFHSSWNNFCTKGTAQYPCEFIQKYPHLSGNVFAVYDWAGFLIWKLPNAKYFIDGRMPAWHDENGESPYSVYLKIVQTQPGWNEKLRKHRTDYLLLSQNTFIDLLLDKDGKKYGWNHIYEDQYHTLYQNVWKY